MNEREDSFEFKFKLEEAKYFYEQMEFFYHHFKTKDSPRKYLYYLDAFLAATRSVTHIFQAEFNDDESIMKWYKKKVQDWKKNKIMKLFIQMRNISLKEETPKPLTIIADTQRFDLSKTVFKVSKNGKIEKIKIPIRLKKKGKTNNEAVKGGIVSVFYQLPKWYDETPDVMYLCKEYLNELKKFVTEAEKLI